MSTNIDDNQIKQELLAIVDQILDKAEEDDKGLFWRTNEISYVPDLPPIWVIDESIYSGTSGIILFLLDVYSLFKELKYKIAIEKSLAWLIRYDELNPPLNYSLYSGRMGLAYVFNKASRELGNNMYLKKAVLIAKKSESYLETEAKVEILNGASGILMGLLHIHAETKDSEILILIEKYIKFIIEKIQIGKKGICWDSGIDKLSGLCGFSHGASGVAFVFLELGKYFNNPSFFWLAEQAFLYESNYYDRLQVNWADLRDLKQINSNPTINTRVKMEYASKNWAYFNSYSYMNAWCHGAVGIGLSRLRAFELLKLKKDKNEILLSIKKTIQTDLGAKKYNKFTLCHGLTGNAFLFLNASFVLKDKKYKYLAYKCARELLHVKSKSGHYQLNNSGKDVSSELFLGLGGIGYFFVHLLKPNADSSILHPSLNDINRKAVNKMNFPFITISILEVQQRIITSLFPRTFNFLKKNKDFRRFLKVKRHSRFDIKKYTKDYLLNLKSLGNLEQAQYKEIRNLEIEKIKIQDSITNYSLLYFEYNLGLEKANDLIIFNDEAFSLINFKLNHNVKLRMSSWDWQFNRKHFLKSKSKKSVNYFFLKRSHNGCEEGGLETLNYLILKYISKKPASVIVLSEYIGTKINSTSRQVIHDLVLTQMKENLTKNLIIHL